MRNAKVINVGVEKTADRCADFVRQKEHREFRCWFSRLLFTRAQVATRCSTCVVRNRNTLLMHVIRKVFLGIAKKRNEERDAPRVGRTGSYGPHEFIRTMIIYCRGERNEKTHLCNLCGSKALIRKIYHLSSNYIDRVFFMYFLFFVYIFKKYNFLLKVSSCNSNVYWLREQLCKWLLYDPW